MLTGVTALLARLAYWVNRVFPRAKSLIPKSLHRFILLRIVGVNTRRVGADESYEWMLGNSPERLFLENEALPWVSGAYRRVLFVGTAPYTYHLEALFRDDPDRYTTIDHNPAAKVWGARHHIVASLQNIDRLRPPGFFDCIVLNGVVGYRLPEIDDYGIIGHEELRKTVRAMHVAIRPGGLLLVGWNRGDMTSSAFEMGLIDPYFVPTKLPPWGARKAFPGDLHVFDCYERRAA